MTVVSSSDAVVTVAIISSGDGERDSNHMLKSIQGDLHLTNGEASRATYFQAGTVGFGLRYSDRRRCPHERR